MTEAPTLGDVRGARERLAGVARETPLYPSETFSRLSGRQVLLKAENLQRTGSFKIRGAYNTIATLPPAEREAGVVAASAGNHGQAVAWAAREAGIGATIFMQQVAFSIRAAIRLASGDGAGAAEDMKRSLHDARAIRDPQALDPALVASAEVAYRNGDLAAANELLEELGSPERAGTWVVTLALLLHDLGRPAAVLVEKRHTTRTPWFEAAVAIADGDFDRAVDVLERTGARTFVAAVRLRASVAYAAQGRSAGAGEHIAPALAFYREVGATAYVREAEALLAKAS